MCICVSLVCVCARAHLPLLFPSLLSKERAAEQEGRASAEFARLRDFLQREEEQVKESLRRHKEETLHQLERDFTHASEQISQLERTADELRGRLREEENPAQLKGREGV